MNERTAHADLLAQVERDEATRDEIRLILSEPLTEADLDYAIGDKYVIRPQDTAADRASMDAQERYKRAPFPIGAHNHTHRHSAGTLVYLPRNACSRCESGLTQCTTPDACQISAERPPLRRGDLRGLLALAIGSWAIVAVAIGAALYAMGVRL